MKKNKKTKVQPRNLKKNRIKSQFSKFKKSIEAKLGRINWGKVGIFAIALLLYVASHGFLGVKAQIIAVSIISLSANV